MLSIRNGFWFILTFVILTSGAKQAEALPVFARSYKVPCSSCHNAIPRRHEFGDAFEYNGYRWPGEETGAEREGDESITRMRGVAFWEGQLHTNLPIGILINMSGSYLDDPNIQEPLQLGNPSLRMVIGGELGEKLSYFGTWSGGNNFSEMHITWNRVLGDQSLYLRFGKLPQRTTLFKANQALIAPYILGTEAFTGHALYTQRLGAEAYGILDGRWLWSVGTVKNKGGSSEFDGYYHLQCKIGGTSFTGIEPDIDLDDPTILDDMQVILAHWGYFGQTQDLAGSPLADIRRVGLELKYQWDALTVWGGAALGFDHDRSINADNRHLTSMVEVSYAINGWLGVLYMYQMRDASSQKEIYEQHDAGIIGQLQENVRARMKMGYTVDKIRNERIELQLLVGM